MARGLAFWIMWFFATLAATTVVLVWTLVGGDRRSLTGGALTDGHHQIELSCETCHVHPPYADGELAKEELNKTCLACHEAELDEIDDTHHYKLFRNPRMASYRQVLDPLFCTSCHLEHRPEITQAAAVTVATDFCIACHGEGDQDIRNTLSSHQDLTFDTCTSVGCHNFHDNQALYSDYLLRHANEAWLAPNPIHELTARYLLATTHESRPVDRAQTVPHPGKILDEAIFKSWNASSHARAEVTCVACHVDINTDNLREEPEDRWIDRPSNDICEGCHVWQTKTFTEGRHGMRKHELLAPPRDPTERLNDLGIGAFVPSVVANWMADRALPTEISVKEARLPMRMSAEDRLVSCGSCHDPHGLRIELEPSAGCAECHADAHTQAYFASPHYQMWLQEISGEGPSGSGVSCATCHLPKRDRREGVVTNHNQNINLRPREKMIRSVCIDCHGLSFAIDALADPHLIESNFNGQPSIHVSSIDWVLLRSEQNRNEEDP